MKKTLAAFAESISNSYKIRKYILGNILSQEKKEIRLNLVYLTYNFQPRSVLVEYYVEDVEYPEIELNFNK